MDLLSKDEFSEFDIQSIIDSHVEESINIEFKAAGALQMNAASKKEMSKDISSMANSDGGLIIYGIEELDHVASALSYIDGREITKEWIENVLISNIQQTIQDLRVIPVRFGGDIQKSVYVVRIPRSPRSPHMMSDNKYYKRINFQAIPMQEYEVRDSYFKIESGALVLDGIKIGRFTATGDKYVVPIYIDIVNEGNGVAEKYKVACWIKATPIIDYNWGKDSIYDITVDTERGLKISTTRQSPVFQNEVLTALTFKMIIPKLLFDQNSIDATINIMLFYPGGFQDSLIDIGSDLLTALKKPTLPYAD